MGKIDGARFVALVDGEVVGQCKCTTDLTRGGALTALRGWGELSELEVSEAWRNRGIGTWLVRQAVAWYRLGGGERMILAVLPEDEDAGAGRFYQRLGWQVFVRFQPLLENNRGTLRKRGGSSTPQPTPWDIIGSDPQRGRACSVP